MRHLWGSYGRGAQGHLPGGVPLRPGERWWALMGRLWGWKGAYGALMDGEREVTFLEASCFAQENGGGRLWGWKGTYGAGMALMGRLWGWKGTYGAGRVLMRHLWGSYGWGARGHHPGGVPLRPGERWGALMGGALVGLEGHLRGAYGVGRVLVRHLWGSYGRGAQGHLPGGVPLRPGERWWALMGRLWGWKGAYGAGRALMGLEECL